MAEFVYLQGAEDVRSAGSAMRSAAEQMALAASALNETLQHDRMLREEADRIRHDQMESLVTRFERAVERLCDLRDKQ
jgi:hypothetical protein